MPDHADGIEDLGGPQTALVLVDLQTGVLTETFAPRSGAEVLKKALSLIDAVRASGGFVAYVRSSHLPDASDRMRVKNDYSPIPATAPQREPGWDQLDPSIKVGENEAVIVKRGFNAFYGSDLDLQLRRRGIKNLIMAGATTNFGVEGTARNAVDHGYNVVIVEDACTSVSAEMHAFSVEKVLPHITRIRSHAEVLAQLSS